MEKSNISKQYKDIPKPRCLDCWKKYSLKKQQKGLYRFLVVGEKVRQTDEFYAGGEWASCFGIGIPNGGWTLTADIPIRRKVKNIRGATYIFLDIGEKLDLTDEYYDGFGWRLFERLLSLGCSPILEADVQVRRKVNLLRRG